MATVTERIRLLFDIDDKAAVGSFGNITKSIKEADGARGKMHAGLASTGAFLKANWVAAAAAAGAAVAAFGTASVKAFQDTSLEAGKMSDALGISVEDASRLMEVAGDLGIDIGAVQGSMQRLNKAIADGKVDRLGLEQELVRTSDGAVDSVQSFVNLATSIGAIKDPTERAQKAQQLFGRSYGEIAELMTMDAEELRDALADVSEQKVIDERELSKAREFRAAMDNLKDRFEDVQLAAGEALVPALQNLAASIDAVDSAAEALNLGGLPGVVEKLQTMARLGNPFGATQEAITQVVGSIDKIDLTTISLEELTAQLEASGFSAEQVTSIVGDWRTAQEDAAAAAEDLGGELEDTTDAVVSNRAAVVSNRAAVQNWNDEMRRAEDRTRDLEDAYADLTGKLNAREAWLNVEREVGNYMTAMSDAELSTGEQEQALIDVQRELVNFLTGLEGVPAEKQTQILAMVDQAQIGAATAQLDALAKTRTAEFKILLEQVTSAEIKQMENRLNRDINGNGVIGRAVGGQVSPGRTYLVGEQGPELLQMGNQGGNVIPNNRIGAVMGGTGSTTVNIMTNADPNSTKAALRRWERRNGPGLS